MQSLDLSARGQFLRSFFRSFTHVEIAEERAVQIWDEVLQRRAVLSGHASQPVSLLTALVDVFASSGMLHFPQLIERDDLKNLERSAVTDPLTGLQNRRLFDATFEKELNRSKRYAKPLSLVALDLHRFKEVNDQLGHPRGDDVLRAVASTLQKSLRTSDSAFRLGGDEFSLLLPQTDAPQAFALSKRFSAVFADVLRSMDISVNVSMDHGIATYPTDADTVDQLVRIADSRLYQAKHANHSKSTAFVEETASPTSTTVPSNAPAPAAFPPAPQAVPAPIEMPRSALATESTLAAAVSASSLKMEVVAPAAHAGVQPRPSYSVQRKAERVSMTGTNAYAVLTDNSARRAKVLDLGFGGVAIELDSKQDLPATFLAVLHVPILPPVRVNLKPVWSRPTSDGFLRVGCCFVS
ncbi:MAG TPA: diguanylate cyclase [Candidatus Acidoferrum sp.]|nr:diguanylate cyclase [Candidatus Acidoferrum sp.]